MSKPDIRKVAVERGLAWIKEGSDLLYQKRQSMWVPALVLLGLTFISVIPVLGIFVAILTPLVMAGVLLGLDRLRAESSDGQLAKDAVFSVFSVPGAVIRIIGLMLFVGISMILVVVIAFGNLGLDLSQFDLTGGTLDTQNLDLSGANWLAFFTMLILGSTPLLMLAYFAMPRIALDRVGLMDAMVSSFRACVKNWASLAVYVLVLLVFSILIAIVALVIGIAVPPDLASSMLNVILLPIQVLINLILLCAQFIMYRDIFPADGKEVSESAEPVQIAEDVEPGSDDGDQFRA